MKKIQRVSDCITDRANSNKGSERGTAMIENSLQQYGWGRSILVDKYGRIICGNKSLEAAASIGIEDAEVIETDGKKVVIVVRTDLDLEKDKRARELAYADNRAGQVDLTWDISQVLADFESGIDLSKFWNDEELAALLGINHSDNNPQTKPLHFSVRISCKTREDMEECVQKCRSLGYEAAGTAR